MKKEEIIKRYGEYVKMLEQGRVWYKAHREEVKAGGKDFEK